MTRHPWPPNDFVCLYEHTCPYLDGLSTKWVLSQYRHLDDERLEYLRLIDVYREQVQDRDDRIRLLERENAELKAKLKALHQRQFKPNRKRESEKNEVGAGRGPLVEKTKKKRGAPVGHPGWMRPVPTRIDRIVPVARPTVCPYCGSDELTPEHTLHEHIQEDIVVTPKTVVTKYVHEEALCPRCRRSVVGKGPDEVPNAPIGPNAKSTAGYLRYGIGISYRKIQRIMSDLFGLTCVPASLVGFDRKAAKRGELIYEDIREKVRASAVVHADETSWRNDGKGCFVWFAGNEELAFFHINAHRSAAAAKAVFGEDFDGVLVRDRYAAYNGIGKDFQACLAHIITNAKDIRREHALLPIREQDRAVTVFCDGIADFCSRACDAAQKLKSGKILWKKAAGIKKRFIYELRTLCKQPLRFKPADTLRTFLIGPEQKHLFTFPRIPGVPPTNNHAEQSLRHMVIFRKVCFGTRSDSGTKTHSIIPRSCRPPDGRVFIQGNSFMSFIRPIQKRHRPRCTIIQVEKKIAGVYNNCVLDSARAARDERGGALSFKKKRLNCYPSIKARKGLAPPSHRSGTIPDRFVPKYNVPCMAYTIKRAAKGRPLL